MVAEGQILMTVGPRGRRIAIETRADGSVRARWYADGRKGRITLPNLYVPAGANTLSAADQRRAETIGLKLSHVLSRGEDPRRVIEQLRERRKPVRKLSSLGAIADEYFAAGGGSVVGKDSLVNYRKYNADVLDILSERFDLNVLSIATVEHLARELSKECISQWHAQATLSKKSEKAYAVWEERKRKGLVRKNGKAPRRIPMPPVTPRGHTRTMKTISWLFTLARWGFDRLRLSRQPALPQHWGETVTKIWCEITKSTPRVVRQFHSLDEMRRLFRVRQCLDPRVQNLLEVALGARLGQARRAMRSDLNLTPNSNAKGQLAIPGGGRKKPGMAIDLSARAVRSFRRAFKTYLKPWEDKYEEGLIDNYALYPGGPLSGLAENPGDPSTPYLSEAYLGELFDAAEVTAGVRKVEKRRFHGLRRFFRNTAASIEKDTRVLDRLMGHHSRGVGGLYEDPEDEWVRRRTYEVREKIIKMCTVKPRRTNGREKR